MRAYFRPPLKAECEPNEPPRSICITTSPIRPPHWLHDRVRLVISERKSMVRSARCPW